MSSFGIPDSERTLKPLIGPLVKTGEKGRTRDGRNEKPVALEYFKVVDSRGELIPAFNDRPERLRIELVSDDIRDFWRDRLNCYDGRTCFCFNDAGGQTALRRSKSGVFQPVECNPSRCALRLNEMKKPTAEDSKAGRLTEYQQEIEERWVPAYRWAHLDQNSRCKSQTYFLFSLPHPHNPGEYITQPGEYARYTSGSHNINNQLLKGLKDIHDSVQGRMRGLRVDLVISFTSNAFGTRVPTVGIVGPNGANELARAIADMSKRRAMLGIDIEKAMGELAKADSETLAAVDADYLYEHFYLGEHQALPEHKTTLALPSPPERVEIPFGTKDPLVAALLDKLRVSYVDQTKLQMRHGANVQGYIDELTAMAEQQKIDITPVLERYQTLTVRQTVDTSVDIPAPAPSESIDFKTDETGSSEGDWSEFTEVDDTEPLNESEKNDLFTDLKKKYENRKDS